MSEVKITLAKTAGFCFGVDRAVKMLLTHIESGKKACTLGPLIHNPDFIRELESRGVAVVSSLEEVPEGHTLFIRTHGITKEMNAEVEASGIEYCDVTCPFVKRIHSIADGESAAGRTVVIAGDGEHPEVRGIKSYAGGRVFVVGSAIELEKLISDAVLSENEPVSLVSQTTFDAKEYKKCKKIANSLCTNAKLFDTICNATALRQAEAQELSGENDMMIVIGGRNSSNTKKLYGVCKENCPSYLIENAAELSEINFNGVRSIGATAGASTPDRCSRSSR